MSSPAKELPHDLLSEKSLVGCLLLDGQSYDQVSDLRLTVKDFYSPQHGITFEAITDLVLENKAVDYVTVCAKLNERGKLEQIGGPSFLTALIEEQASSANIHYYGKIVKDKSRMRDMVRAGMRVASLGREFTGKTEDFVEEVEGLFFKLTSDAKSGTMVQLKNCLVENLKDLEDSSRTHGEVNGLPTGYQQLDRFFLGMRPGQLIVLAARPGMGKTSLALNIASNVCRKACEEKQRLPCVAIFSLEMVSGELSMRLLSAQAKIESKKLLTKNFTPEDLKSLGMAVEELSSYPIFINDSGDTTVLDIQGQCRKLQNEYGLGLIIVDYIQLMSSVNKTLPREQQIAEMSRALKTMAKELQCPILAMSQLNRAVEGRPNKRPNTSDLRESGAIEQDADMVAFVYRDEMYNPDTPEPGVAEIIIGKNRNGETGTAKLAWVGRYTSFEDLSPASVS